MLCPLQVSAVKYHTKAVSTFHQINAFEEDGFLMLDLCCADDGKAINNYLLQNMRKSGEALNEVGFGGAACLAGSFPPCLLTPGVTVVLLPGVRQPVPALPTPLRAASPRQRRSAAGEEPEHSPRQPRHLRESRQRQGECAEGKTGEKQVHVHAAHCVAASPPLCCR